ncbi:MAG TPA: hypothetical protein VJ123_06235 [Anaerolineales bacterium]|nr:hypothetical protein [Anaerolineales bacterium]
MTVLARATQSLSSLNLDFEGLMIDEVVLDQEAIGHAGRFASAGTG